MGSQTVLGHMAVPPACCWAGLALVAGLAGRAAAGGGANRLI
jgi:hypothetical protein